MQNVIYSSQGQLILNSRPAVPPYPAQSAIPYRAHGWETHTYAHKPVLISLLGLSIHFYFKTGNPNMATLTPFQLFDCRKKTAEKNGPHNVPTKFLPHCEDIWSPQTNVYLEHTYIHPPTSAASPDLKVFHLNRKLAIFMHVAYGKDSFGPARSQSHVRTAKTDCTTQRLHCLSVL